MKVITNISLINRHGDQQDQQAIVINNGLIVWVGAQSALPQEYLESSTDIEDGAGHLITSGLIDCHTHLVYSGHRAREFQMKRSGASYADIARAGGGIVSTVKQTRQASEDALFAESLPRLEAMIAEGVTTVEIKSGYGLDLEHEIKMLRVARRLGAHTGIRVRTTFLGAHAVPMEYRDRSEDYVNLLCDEMLPEIKAQNLADAVDVFCESIGFSLAQTEKIFDTAASLGLAIKCHAEQLSNMGASALAAKYKALSCDHLEFLDAKGADAMARAGTVAVLLPGAFYFLQETRKPPVQLLREAGVPMAIATDCNPGSSPTTSLRLMMSMAAQFFGLTTAEVLAGVTHHAAKALGLADSIGVIAPGAVADLVMWSLQESDALCYYFAYPIPHKTMIGGQWMSSTFNTR